MKSLNNYSIFMKNKSIPILYNSERIILYMQNVFPEPICLNSNDYKVTFYSKDYVAREITEEKQQCEDKNILLGLDIFPERPEKYPKFLFDMMVRDSPKKIKTTSKNRSRTHQISLLPFDESDNHLQKMQNRVNLSRKIKTNSNSSIKTHNSILPKLNMISNTPKIINFNLPNININKKKFENSYIKQPISIQKWFRSKKRAISYINDPEFMPLEVIAHYKLNKEINNL